MGADQGAGGIEHLFLGLVTGEVVGGVDLIAQGVGDGGLPVGGIVGIPEVGAIGRRHFRQLADPVILESRRLAVDRAADQPASNIVGQIDNQPVGIGDSTDPAGGRRRW